jgi:hypothetical protein
MDAAGGAATPGVVLDGGRSGRPAPGGGGRARLLGDGVRRRPATGRSDLHPGELAFAGHPTVGTGGSSDPGGRIDPARPAGDVATWQDGDLSGSARGRRGPPDHPRQAGLGRGRRGAHGPAARRGLVLRVGLDRRDGRFDPVALLRVRPGHRGGRGDRRRGGDDGRAAGQAARDPPGGRVGAPRPARRGRTVEVGGRVEAIGIREMRTRQAVVWRSDTVDLGVTTTTSPSPAHSTTGRRTDHARQRRVLRHVQAGRWACRPARS